MEKKKAENTEYERNSRAARIRDRHHCRICGSMFNLETHHLVPRSIAGRSVRHSLSNLITVCRDHHEEITRHVLRLYPLDLVEGANGKVRVEKFDKDVNDYIVAMEAA
jgi:5-methylcytosine-specific restriction endonuclease McrA